MTHHATIRGRAFQAQAYTLQVGASSSRSYGPDHPVVWSSILSLARVLTFRGDLNGAEAHYREALELRGWVEGQRQEVKAAEDAQPDNRAGGGRPARGRGGSFGAPAKVESLAEYDAGGD